MTSNYSIKIASPALQSRNDEVIHLDSSGVCKL